jgi:hypothetical protein
LGRWAFEVSMKASHGDGEKIRSALNAQQVDTREWQDARNPFKNLSAWLEGHHRQEQMLLEDIASLWSTSEATDHQPERDQYWSLASVGDLLEATKYGTTSVQEFARAFRHDTQAIRRGWLDAVADAYGIDKMQAAREAAWMLDEREVGSDGERRLDDNWFVASMSSPSRRRLTDDAVAALDHSQHEALLDALRADSDWIAWAAAEILINVSTPSWDPMVMFETDMGTWPLDRAALVYMVAIISAGESSAELLAKAAESPEAEYRMAALHSLLVTPELDPNGEVATQLRRDPDLTVRPKSSREQQPSASYWTCNRCHRRNDLEVEDCPGCDDGTRPG